MLRDLQLANLQELRLRSIDVIPEALAHTKLHSVKILRFEGECRLKDSVSSVSLQYSFSHRLTPIHEQSTRISFFTLLSSFPNLTHLELYGYNLFAESEHCLGPLEMPELDDLPLYIRYSTLCVLLTVLRRSDIIYFSYGGEFCDREMRWTRSNKEEEFVKDCWTL